MLCPPTNYPAHCRYTLDTIASRIPGIDGFDVDDASGAYAVCRPCQRTLATTDPRLTRRLGYIVDSPRQAASTPVYWRQTRWVYFDGNPTIRAAAKAEAGLLSAG